MLQAEFLLRTLLDEFIDTLAETEANVSRRYILPNTPKLIQAVIGMRRTGKTQFLFQIVRELLAEKIAITQILYLNFEDDRLLPMQQAEFAELIEAFYALYPENHHKVCYFFFDEIQNVQNWELVIRRFHDSKKVKIYLTGSSAKMLSKEIASSLRGRSIATEMWPYSFKEYLTAQNLDFPPEHLSKRTSDHYKKYLLNYFQRGGFPAIQYLTVAERLKILQNYVDTVIYRDIIERYEITNITLIKYLVKTLLKLAAAEYSPNKLYNDLKSQGFKVSKDTIYNYVHYIEDAYLAFPVSLYAESLRKTQVNPKKIYAVDNGLVNAYTMNTLDNYGKMFENLVYLDLRRLGHEIYYYKTADNYEIDFFTKDANGKLHLYQVVWDIQDKKTLEREQRALVAAGNELGITGELIDPITYFSKFIASNQL